MSFEAGKKYKRRYFSGVIFTCLASHKIAGGVWGFCDSTESYIPGSYQWGADWSEYTEPRSISKWINVWERPSGEVNFGETQYKSKENAQSYHQNGSDWRCIDTIEVIWTEKF